MNNSNQPWHGVVSSWLQSLEENQLRRRLKSLERDEGMKVQLKDQQGKTLVNFSSNDYLGLATSQELKSAMIEAVGKYGVGTGASRLICGNLSPHEQLEETLAEFKGTESALAFSSGYAVSVGVLPALCGESDTIILDKLSHASLIDGAKLSGATIRVFPHNDMLKLERLLKSVRAKDATSRVLVVTESVFSMDGDVAPLKELVEIKDRYGAWLLVDEAHGVGVLGPQGRGLVAKLGLEKRVELQMGTLSKAIGVSGGYVATTRQVVDLLINRARSLIYSTAPSPAVAATANFSIHLMAGPEGECRRERLWHHHHTLTTAVRDWLKGDVPAAIVPIILGQEGLSLQLSEQLTKEGYLVSAIRYPTVGRGKARLRVSLSALHESIEVEGLVRSLQRCLSELKRGEFTLPVEMP